jgi:tRNA(fMet)-specific endonuclease VapC
MKYLLDTNHCSYIQQKRPELLNHLRSLPPDAVIMTSVVTQGELLAGIALIKDDARKAKLKQVYTEIMTILADILVIDSQVAQAYAEIFADLRRNGTPIPTNDLWIAAIAKAHNLILTTNDEHFQHVNGLQTEDWTKQSDSQNASTQATTTNPSDKS